MPRRFNRALAALTAIAFSSSCSDTNGAAVAVTLHLYSVDGVVIPVPMTSSAGKAATVGSGFLQGNNWGHACGFSVGLAQGPVTFAEIPDCRLYQGEERSFTVTLLDSRFPSGPHVYRFVPDL